MINGEKWEYKILSQRDNLFSGRFDSATITDVLNRLGSQGWRVVTVTSSGVNTLLGGNRDEIMIFLERRVQYAAAAAVLPPATADDETRYSLEIGGKERGPFTVAQLHDLFRGGHIAGDTIAMSEDGGKLPLADILR